MKILHISEALGGGVTTAIAQYVRSSPQHEHHILATVRESAKVNIDAFHGLFSSILDLPAGRRNAIKAIRKAFRELLPDKVHLHSSYAGVYGRLAGLPRKQVIYTPHCYAFERRDLGVPARIAIYVAEQALSLGGSFVAGVSPREEALGRRMIGTYKSFFLPNTAATSTNISKTSDKHRKTIVTVGRLCSQKDPLYFSRVAKLAKSIDPDIQFLWLGGGDRKYEKLLIDSGVIVTGWLTHSEVLSYLSGADGYLHTASWEGNPMSIIEASAAGLPIYARDISALRALGLSHLAKNEQDLAEQVAYAAGSGDWSVGLAHMAEIAKISTLSSQEIALDAIYKSN